MWYVYILKCSDDTYYTGITKDIKRRIKQHNSGDGARYTRGRTPVELVYKEECEDRSEASIRENEIKSKSREDKKSLFN